MSTATTKSKSAATFQPTLLARVLREGFGPGAWHGPDLKAALADVTPATAFQRPGPGRHNIAEVAMHHAWCVRSVAGQLGAAEGTPFALAGSDWFTLNSERDFAWAQVVSALGGEQERLERTVADLVAGRHRPSLGPEQQLDLVLGITCHAVYHAGQIQLIKVLIK